MLIPRVMKGLEKSMTFSLGCDGERSHSQVCLLLEGAGRGQRGGARETDAQLERAAEGAD